ncbi:LapA family protein [Vagococcus vulneris]|uniref:Lipopolysaccharide assembly protein A domain-containing protein n=1 Tax=Vagococcus vulneris TaxID=1977869 RepID=A0A429ZXT0_9ENTE|nr:LapA family protein [Vagococcus vulneris]RST98711.1 hypothetical protein CBF37_06585 [Vagococcus vulneris]
MSRKTKVVVFVLFIFLLILFSIVNAQEVSINLFFTTIRLPIIVLILGCFIVSFLISMLLLFSTVMKRNRQIKRQNKMISQLEFQSKLDYSDEAQTKINHLEQVTQAQTREISDLRHKLASYILDEADEENNND